MQQSGEYEIAAPRAKVWAALNDPDVLRVCITGCQSLEATGEHAFEATVKAKVGPVSATFRGAVELQDLNPPESYTLAGSGKGGAAGFASGEARVRLTDRGAVTLLSYDLDAKVGGKLAQIGSRLVDGTARKMADEFFAAFKAEVEGEPASPPAERDAGAAQAPAEAQGERRYESSGKWVIWAVVAVLLLVAMSLPIVMR